MLYQNQIKYILLILLLFGCAAKKEEFRTEVVKDSVFQFKQEIKTKPINTSIVFPDLCDTITGKPREFKQFETSGENKAKVYTFDNKLFIDLFVAATSQTKDSISEKKDSKIEQAKKEIRYKTPLWMWITIILSVLINLILLRFTFFR